MADSEITSLRAFWPFYLGEHRNPLNRWLHAIGSLAGLGFLGTAIATRNPYLIPAGLVCGYAFAWVGHFVVERNRPATFKYPLWSFLCDWRLLAITITFRAQRAIDALPAPTPQNAPTPETPVAAQ